MKEHGFIKQLEKPYQSTIFFEEYLKKNGCLKNNSKILDVGCGYGATLHYLKEKNPQINFIGIDYNPDNIDKAKYYAKINGFSDLNFETGDWFNLPKKFENYFDGVFSIYTLCCFKNIDQAISSLCELNPEWISFISLFYDGDLDVLIHIRDDNWPEIDDDNPDGDFNIFSIEKTKKIFDKYDYEVEIKQFFPSAPIPKDENNKGRGSYTINTEMNEHSVFSGPVYLPWHIVLAKKKLN